MKKKIHEYGLIIIILGFPVVLFFITPLWGIAGFFFVMTIMGAGLFEKEAEEENKLRPGFEYRTDSQDNAQRAYEILSNLFPENKNIDTKIVKSTKASNTRIIWVSQPPPEE